MDCYVLNEESWGLRSDDGFAVRKAEVRGGRGTR